jgi:hypothetical protein
MSRLLARAALLGAAIALGTVVAGWWAVPVLGAVWGAADRRGRRPALTAALGGALGWAGLLAWDAARGPVRSFAGTVGGVVHLPGWALLLATVLFAAALAAAAAALLTALTARPIREP